MLAFGGIHKAEMHPHWVLGIVWAKAERVVAQVFASLDVVLISICPVERNLFAFVGDGINTRFVDALGEEIPLRIVSAKETEQVVVDLALQCAQVHGFVGELVAQFFNLG